MDASLVEARTLAGDTFSDDDLAKEFVDLEVALEDVPTAQPVAGAPMAHSAVAVAERAAEMILEEHAEWAKKEAAQAVEAFLEKTAG